MTRATVPGAQSTGAASTTPLGDALRRFSRDRAAMFGLVVVLALVAFAAIGPLVIGHDPNHSYLDLGSGTLGGPPGPSARHWLGTDSLHRDVLARLAHGARLSLFVAITATLIATTLGAAIGLLSGYLAGSRWSAVDGFLMRLVDTLLALSLIHI